MEFIPTPVGGPKPPVKVLSKQYKARRRRRFAAALLVPVAIGCVTWSVVKVKNAPRQRTAIDQSAATPENSIEARAESAAAPMRPIYRYSVVPGGVRSPEEIEYVVARDVVVAAHYEGINPRLMRNEQLQQPLLAHVSYRIGHKVYWTKNRVQLPKNEPVMTDGTRMIRERCGNLISLEPLAPVSEEEPALPSFDLPMSPIEFAWMQLHYTPPGIPAKPKPDVPAALYGVTPVGVPGLRTDGTKTGTPTTQSVDPPDPSITPFGPVEPPLPVPEPSTLTLVGLAGAAGIAHQLRKRARLRGRR